MLPCRYRGARIAGELVPVTKLSAHLDGEICIPLFTRRVPQKGERNNSNKISSHIHSHPTPKKEEKKKKEKKYWKTTNSSNPQAMTL